jgi:hypothetical protein
MRHKIIWLGILAAVATPLPTAAQSSAVADLLRAITVRIEVENATTGQAGLCHGFVDVVRYDIAYVVTAKHCVEELNSAKLAPTTLDPTLTVGLAYANGATGRADVSSGTITMMISLSHRLLTAGRYLCPANVRTAEPTRGLLGGSGFQCSPFFQLVVDHPLSRQDT